MEIKKTFLWICRKGYRFLSGVGMEKFYRIYPASIVNTFLHFLTLCLKSNIVKIEGQRMFLDSKDSLCLSIKGVHEPFETGLIKREIKKGDIALDIGAHIGYYTLIFAKLVGEEGRVYSFEPEENNFSLLEKNVKINGYRNAVLEKMAVTAKTGKAKLYLSKEGSIENRIYNLQSKAQSKEIEAVCLDDYFINYHGKIDFIKIDAEGAEWEVIRGAGLLLQKNKNIKILTEFRPIELKKAGVYPEEYLQLLITHGFKLYNIDERKVKPADVSKLAKIYTPEKKNGTNLFCIKE